MSKEMFFVKTYSRIPKLNFQLSPETKEVNEYVYIKIKQIIESPDCEKILRKIDLENINETLRMG